MIRYPVSETELVALIKKKQQNWFDKAEERTLSYVADGKYSGGSEFWGQIKQVYIDLQYEKCAYCETKLQGADLASKVHEVEHYRPKSSIKAWPNRAISYWKDFHHDWPTGEASDKGYYRLAYHYLNYAIACTRCNSTLKSNYFPIRGPRDFVSDSPTTMQGESALLLYPISSVDPDDPEHIITFDGVLAVPVKDQGPGYERAVTTIEFFQLNHQDLTSRRAEQIRHLWTALTLAEASAEYKQPADKVILGLCSPRNEFSACLNAYHRLYQTDKAKAEKIARLIIEAD